MENDTSVVAARTFTRNLNILLKTVRLYGVEHERTSALFETAWSSLLDALQQGGETGLLLGVSSSQVLMDGIPLDPRPVDRSFAQLLSSAGLSSIHFSRRVTADDFTRLVRAFGSRGPKSAAIAADLKAALATTGEPAIRVNEVRFVAQDAALAEAGVAAQLVAQSLGAEAQKLKEWLEDPQKLLQLIVAAEGVRRGGEAMPNGAPSGITATKSPSPSVESRAAVSPPPPSEEEVFRIMRLLTQLGQESGPEGGKIEVNQFQEQVQGLPAPAQFSLTQALAALASMSPAAKPDTPMLLQLAEQVAIRYAIDSFERGDAQVSAVVQLLNRLKREIKALRGVLSLHEESMSRAGMQVESFAEVLDRQFWTALPESAKRKVLLSSEAWAIPPRNIRHYVEELLNQGQKMIAREILLNYSECLRVADSDARKKTWAGLNELADLYVRVDDALLQNVIRQLGESLLPETETDLQTLIGAGFVRYSHEAARVLNYPAVQQSLETMERLEKDRASLAQTLWPRVKVAFRVHEFVEDALKQRDMPAGLLAVMRRMPHATVENIASRLQRCALREERERLVQLARELGGEGIAQLRKTLDTRPATEAALTVGLLSRLEPDAIGAILPRRLREWDRSFHDLVVRQLSIAGAPERAQMLVSLLDVLDPASLPEAVDEIGMSGEGGGAARLLRILESPAGPAAEPYLRVKAVEALGRLRDSHAGLLLRGFVEARQFLRWQHPHELRITAFQAMQKIDPAWAGTFLPRSGLTTVELSLAPLDPVQDTPWVRQRRYERVQLAHALEGMVSTPQGDTRLSVSQLSLGGGVASCQRHLKPGTVTRLELQAGFHRIHAEVLVREARPQQLSFELVRIPLDDRTKLRRPLAEVSAARSQA